LMELKQKTYQTDATKDYIRYLSGINRNLNRYLILNSK